MAKLTEYTDYDDAQKLADARALWELFDGSRQHLISPTSASAGTPMDQAAPRYALRMPMELTRSEFR